MPRYDVIIIGVGGMGSAAAYHLARRGKKVLALERFDIPHEMGSSHGITRIIRLAYHEHPSYVPLLRRAYELWRELQRESNESLLHITGCIEAGPAGSQVFEGCRQSCEVHNLPHEILTARQVAARFPAYHLPPQLLAVLQPDGGFLHSERCITAHVSAAKAHGAEIHTSEPVVGWETRGNGVRVTTERATYDADRLVFTAGAWENKLVDVLAGVLAPERQVVTWFKPQRPEIFMPKNFPVFVVATETGDYYGYPIFGIEGLKIGRFHHFQEPIDPDNPNRTVRPRDEQMLRDFTATVFPEGAGTAMASKVCIFTNTADGHFILDLHPKHLQVVLASPCSGHGFKFCSVVGEIVADLVERGDTRHDINRFRLARLTKKS